jgi:hypothetical protein
VVTRVNQRGKEESPTIFQPIQFRSPARPFSESFLKFSKLRSSHSVEHLGVLGATSTPSPLRKTIKNTLTETTDSVHRPSVVSEKFSNFLRTSAGNSIHYEAVNAMLLNEFFKAHRRIDEQEATIARIQKQIDAVTAGLQKVSAQLAAASPSDGGLEVSKPATQTMLNSQ